MDQQALPQDSAMAIVAKLDELLVALSKPAVPFKDTLWDKSQVSSYLGVSASHFSARIAVKRGFPAAINLTGAKSTCATKRWKAGEIIAWADRQRE